MSKFKKLYLPLFVSVAMNIGNMYASEDDDRQVAAHAASANVFSPFGAEQIDALPLTNSQREQVKIDLNKIQTELYTLLREAISAVTTNADEYEIKEAIYDRALKKTHLNIRFSENVLFADPTNNTYQNPNIFTTSTILTANGYIITSSYTICTTPSEKKWCVLVSPSIETHRNH